MLGSSQKASLDFSRKIYLSFELQIFFDVNSVYDLQPTIFYNLRYRKNNIEAADSLAWKKPSSCSMTGHSKSFYMSRPILRIFDVSISSSNQKKVHTF